MKSPRRRMRLCMHRPDPTKEPECSTPVLYKFYFHSCRELKRLFGSGVDIRANESLAQDGEEAALGLLSLGSANVDEVVDGCWGGGCW